jgi:hypothetical protein
LVFPSTHVLLTYLLTYPIVQDIIWKADSHSACQKIYVLYGTRRFITVFTKACHWTLSWASRIQFAPSIPVSLRYVLFPLLRSCQRISPGPRRFETFRNNNIFYGEGLLAPRPTPKLENHPYRLFATVYSVYSQRRTFLHPQLEDAPCRGDKGPTQSGLMSS